VEFAEQRYARIFWSSRYAEFEEREGALEYFGQVGTRNLRNEGALLRVECFGQAIVI
jgi:hypothetical protein